MRGVEDVRPSLRWLTVDRAPPAGTFAQLELGAHHPGFHDQSLRNHSVGSTCRSCATGAAVGDRDPNQHVVGIVFRVLDEDVEVLVADRISRCRSARTRALLRLRRRFSSTKAAYGKA